MNMGVSGKMRLLRFDKERLSYYRDVALFALGAFLIIGMASQFDQWLTEHRLIHLEFSLALLLVTCAFFFLIPNRTFVAIGATALVVLFGVVGMIVNQSLTGMPVVLICAVLAFVLVKWKGGTIKLK